MIIFICCFAPLTLPFVSLFYVDAVAMGICPVAMELLLFKLPWLPYIVSWESEALPARYPLNVVVVVLRIWLLWLPQFGGGSPWWLQNTWRGAVHLLPCSLQKIGRTLVKAKSCHPMFMYMAPKGLSNKVMAVHWGQTAECEGYPQGHCLFITVFPNSQQSVHS